jgi:2-polyprenyl-3-methyl-5-hydroxy-6-metoxy-1,4-benzoquinol methylase
VEQDRGGHASTEGSDYAERLLRLEQTWWKRWLDVQRPYRWNLRRLVEGRVLDVGCGIGRNLVTLGDRAVGVDHNADSVALARRRGCTAYTPEEFRASEHAAPGGFDTMLLAHVVEHMTRAEAVALLRQYLPYVRSGGRVALVCPQEKGYASDATHVEFLDLDAMSELCGSVGASVERRASFPLPRVAGTLFTYNEFVVAARLP